MSLKISEAGVKKNRGKMCFYQLGDTKVQVEEGVWVAENAVVVGNVLLKENSSVWFNAVIRGDNDLITIGEGANIQDGSVLHSDREALSDGRC